jgi:2-dehydro-3-deoxy-D-arabinonate dehydratase
LGRDNSFLDGVILLTGTGIVPPDHFTLASGDEIRIEMTGVGRLVNVVK